MPGARERLREKATLEKLLDCPAVRQPVQVLGSEEPLARRFPVYGLGHEVILLPLRAAGPLRALPVSLPEEAFLLQDGWREDAYYLGGCLYTSAYASTGGQEQTRFRSP